MAHQVLHVIKSGLVLFLELLISIVLSLVIVPVGFSLAFFNEIVRLFVSLALWARHRGPNKISLTPEGADNIWAYQRVNNARICLSVLFCTEQIDIVQHRKLYMSRVLNHTTKNGRKPYEKLRKILITKYGYHCHKNDDNFDIRNHVRIWKDEEDGGAMIVTEAQFMSEVLPALFKDMDESKPQWEEVIIPRFQWNKKVAGPNNTSVEICTVRIFRYHHGIMDGASNLLLWTACMTDDQGASFPYPVNPLVDSGKVSRCQRFLYDLSCVMLGAFTMVKSVINAGRLKSRFVTLRYSGKRNFAWSEAISVEQLRRIKACYKSSVPAMLTTALGCAFRKLNEKYPDALHGNPEEIVIGLVSALLPYPNADLRNQFTVVHFPVHTGNLETTCDQGSRLQRLQIINRSMTKVGRDPMVYLNYFMFKYFGRFPACLIQHMMENGGLPVVFSNVPMSTQMVEFWGNPVISAAGWPPLLTNTGLGIVTMRYADHMRFCAVSDDSTMSPEALEFFLKEVAQELNELDKECSDFETVVHKDSDVGRGNTSIIMANGNVVHNSYVNPKSVSINTVTLDFRRGSVPSQIIDTIE